MHRIIDGRQTSDGAGVKLFRVFSNDTAKLTDPFLLLDHFGSQDPQDYLRGFPWHPHRGIETVTYLLKGEVEHQDSLGNKGVIRPGELQWMSAGSGIIHQEMPKGAHGMEGFQLWVNLPATHKMSPPRYQGIASDQVKVVKEEGIAVKVIAGTYQKTTGPVLDLMVDVVYLDITLEEGKSFTYTPKKEYTTLCYVMQGKGSFSSHDLTRRELIVSRDIDTLAVHSYEPLRFLLISGKPLRESIAWGGPIVMNTQEELREAFREFQEGTFIKK